jgi:hypothetical protein
MLGPEQLDMGAMSGFRLLAEIWRTRAENIISKAGASPNNRWADRLEKDFWSQMADDAEAVAQANESAREQWSDDGHFRHFL